MMKKLLLLVMTVLCLSGMAVASAAEGHKIAVVPYLNTSEETKGYVTDTVKEGYTDYFAKEGMTVLSKEQTEAALIKAGYVVADQMLPDKDMMENVAKSTGADYVVALEVADLKSTRHMAYFSNKVSTTAKLKYHFYNAATGKMVAFQTTAANNNKAVMVGMRSYKGSITAALQETLEKGNERIKGLL